jgi:glycosyltransferase involved in cell wall biosynthesis
LNPLVSIITPCYNGEGKVNIFLDSVLKQTYDNIEFIIINDGSTDNTEEIILSYKNKFIDKGYKFIYLKQKNLGPDSALNNGLKYFSGDYITWPDSDDILSSTSIETRVDYLEKNKNKGLVYCNVNIVDGKNIKKIIQKKEKILYDDRKKNFEDILLARWIFSGSWMIRSKFFLEINPNRNLIITGQGQNFQMLLPMAWNYDMGKINSYMYTCVNYKDSHSHKERTYKENLKRFIDMEMGLIKILKECNMEEKLFCKYRKILETEYINFRLNLNISYRKNKEAKELYHICKERNIKLYRKNKIKYYLNLFGVYTILKKIKNKVKNE